MCLIRTYKGKGWNLARSAAKLVQSKSSNYLYRVSIRTKDQKVNNSTLTSADYHKW